jgi:hypothetical protein
MKVPVTITTAAVEYATQDGSVLELAGEVQAHLSLAIAAGSPESNHETPPWTAVAATFEFADSTGELWQIVSRFDSALLVRACMDFSNGEAITPWSAVGAELQASFETNLALRDVWFNSDDRCMRPLLVGESIRQIYFKYFGVKFDIALIPHMVYRGFHSPRVYARTGPMWDYQVNEIPPLLFPIEWEYFLDNRYCLKTGKSQLPIPFCAEHIGSGGEPQASVKQRRS